MEPVNRRRGTAPPAGEPPHTAGNPGRPPRQPPRRAATAPPPPPRRGGVAMVLSGMSTLEQMQDNLGYMANFQPLTPPEQEAVRRACAVLKNQETIACTGAGTARQGCPHAHLHPRSLCGIQRQEAGSQHRIQLCRRSVRRAREGLQLHWMSAM